MSIGNRMKENYESRSQGFLVRRMPVILRLDGKAFHTYTKGFKRPFDDRLLHGMMNATFAASKEIHGSKFAYIQSDEVSILITDFDRLSTEAWFNYNIQKMTSVAASLFTLYFNKNMKEATSKDSFFDARVFNVPKEEVVNYFIWRQRDWWRNSISMLTRHLYSHNECHGKSTKNMHEMLHEKGINWNNLAPQWKNGQCLDLEVGKPLILTDFNKNRNYFSQILEPKEV